MEAATPNELAVLAGLLRQRNAIDLDIARLIGRPAEKGHLGEFIASRLFPISLATSATTAGIDGHMTEGPLTGCSVNIKYYGKHEGILDIGKVHRPDFYLVLTGPTVSPASSRNSTRPFLVEQIFLFETAALLPSILRAKFGIATSVRQALWQAANVYPTNRETRLPYRPGARDLLAAFGPHTPR